MTSFQSRPIAERLLLIVMVTCVLNAILIAVPGYFSHDELDWLNRIQRGQGGWDFGLGDYHSSPFLRVLGAFIISAALRLPLQPFGSHAAMVLLQAVNCCLLYGLVSRFRPDRALAAAVLFAVMPATAFVAGWIAAGFDLLFTLFGLCALLAAVSFWRLGSWMWGVLAVAAFAAALLCKESALTLPLTAFVLAILDSELVEWRRVAVLAVGVVSVAALYLLLRIPALVHNGQTGEGGYGFSNMLAAVWHAIAYLGFPFAVTMPETSGFLDRYTLWIAIPVALHVLLLVLLWARFGFRGPLLYLVGYFIPLLPVLLISKYETQYLYAPGIVTSVALAMVWKRSPLFVVPTAVLALLLVDHSLTVQRNDYTTGGCQTRALETAAAVLPFLKPSDARIIYAPNDTPWWVLARAVFQNPIPLGDQYVFVEFSQHPDGATMRFLPNCGVVLASSGP